MRRQNMHLYLDNQMHTAAVELVHRISATCCFCLVSTVIAYRFEGICDLNACLVWYVSMAEYKGALGM